MALVSLKWGKFSLAHRIDRKFGGEKSKKNIGKRIT